MAVGGETALLTHEAERGDGRKPIKPLSRIRHQVQLALLRTDDHIGSLRAVFDQRRHAGPSKLFCRKKPALPTRRASRLLPCPLLLRIWKHWPSHQWLHEVFQGRNAMLDSSLSLLKQRQSELGELLLKGTTVALVI